MEADGQHHYWELWAAVLKEHCVWNCIQVMLAMAHGSGAHPVPVNPCPVLVPEAPLGHGWELQQALCSFVERAVSPTETERGVLGP